MVWEVASDLVATLRGQGKTDAEIILKLENTTDRYRNYYKNSSDRNAHLRKQIIDLRVKHGELLNVRVDTVWLGGWENAYIYWKNVRYVYNGEFFQKDTKTTFDPYDADSVNWQFNVLIEPIYYHRPLETKGEVVGTLHSKQLVEIEPIHGFSRGDKVYVRQEK